MPGIFFGKPHEQIIGVVLGAVIHNDKFPWAAEFIKGPDRFFYIMNNPARLVISGHYYRHHLFNIFHRSTENKFTPKIVTAPANMVAITHRGLRWKNHRDTNITAITVNRLNIKLYFSTES